MKNRDNDSIEGNTIVTFGGGLVDPAAYILIGLARRILAWGLAQKVWIVRYSVDGLCKEEDWIEFNDKLKKEAKGKRGTWFGTSRDPSLTDKDVRETVLNNCKKNNVNRIVFAGGDGTSRMCAEAAEFFLNNGIQIVFAIPLSIDGINGSTTIGRRQAARESLRQIENIASTSLETKSKGEFGVVAIELQGRNRDDIMAKVLKMIQEQGKVGDRDLRDILLRVVPANFRTNEKKLYEQINASKKRTLLLISEGAAIKVDDLTKKDEKGNMPVTRKVRTLAVGHPSQSNNQTNADDREEYREWMDFVVRQIYNNPIKPFSTSLTDGHYKKREIDYFLQRNPRDGQKALLPRKDEYLIKSNMAQ